MCYARTTVKMFGFVHYRCRLVVTVIVNLVLERNLYIYAINTPRRDGVDVFNLLLGDITDVLSSSENRNYHKKYQELKEIENVIHPLIKKQSKHFLDKPEYDVENIDTENFKIDLVLPDKVETDYRPANKYDSVNILEQYGFTNSKENKIPINAPNTKLLPVNQWLLPNSIKHISTSIKKFDRKNRPQGNENQYRQIPKNFQEAPIISDNELTADVVVL